MRGACANRASLHSGAPDELQTHEESGSVTLAEVQTLTLEDIRRAQSDPDYFPDYDKNARALLERMAALSFEERASVESREFVFNLRRVRGWITTAAWARAVAEAQGDFKTWRDRNMDERFRR